jgi:hypothetical protein
MKIKICKVGVKAPTFLFYINIICIFAHIFNKVIWNIGRT